MAQQRFSSSQEKVSPEKLMSSPVFESLQSDNMPLEADSKILYANPFAGVEPVPMPADLKEIFNDPNITLTAPNFRTQLEQLMNQYDGDAGPWYVDGSDGFLLIHNKKLTDKTETLYRWQDENGEVLKVQITTNWVSAGAGQSMVSLGGSSKGLYGTTNIDPTLDDVIDQYGSPDEPSPTSGLNVSQQRGTGSTQFATGIQKTNRYPAIKHEPEPVIRTMDGTSQATLRQRENQANANAIQQYSGNTLFLQKVTDAIQQLIQKAGLTGVQTGLLRVQLLDYIKTGNVGSVLGLIINKQIPLADKTIYRFTHRSRLRYTKTFFIKGGKPRAGSDMILEDIKNHIKNSASNMVGKSRDQGVAEWKINGTWYTDAEITAMARRQSADGSGRMGYTGAPGNMPRGVPYNAQRYIEQTTREASQKYFITDATVQGSSVVNYGDRIVVTIDMSGHAPVKVTVKDMINMLAQREGSPVAMIKQANMLRNANKKAKRKEIEMQMIVIGNPMLEAGQSLLIENIGKKYSGLWHIKTCVHKLDSNGFTSSLTLNKGAGSSGVTVSTASETQSTGAKTKGKGTGSKTVVTPNRTDNWNSGDIALLQSVGASAQSGNTEAQQTYNQMVDLMKYASEHSSTGEPLYEVDTSEFVYNYPTEHTRPYSGKGTPKVKMTKKGQEMLQQRLREQAAEKKRQAEAAAAALKNSMKPFTGLPRPSYSFPSLVPQPPQPPLK